MLATMQRSGADFTNTFRSLSRIDPPTTDEGCVVRPQTFDPVLEYILAQSASLEAMRKKSVAAFHPQALRLIARGDANKPAEKTRE